MRCNYLKKLYKEIRNNYYCSFKDDNILSICKDKNSLPFCYVCSENGSMVLSFSVDFNLATVAAEITLLTNKIKKAQIGPEFYISNQGYVHWEEEALTQFELEQNTDLLALEPINKWDH